MSDKEYAERLKAEIKEIMDDIGTESEYDQRIIKIIYGFVWSGFRESETSRGVYQSERRTILQGQHC